MNEYNYKVIKTAIHNYIYGTISHNEHVVSTLPAVRIWKLYYCVEAI